MITTIPLGAVLALTRSPFTPLLDAAGNHRHTADGEPYFAADVFVAGALGSPFATPVQARPGEIRVRSIGDPRIDANTVVRIDDARLSTWSQRVRGTVRTDAVITAGRVINAPGERPHMRGGLPALFPASVPLMFLDYVPATRPDEPGTATLGIAPVEGTSWVVDGLAEVLVTGAPSPDLFPGAEVSMHDLVAAYFVPGEGSRDAARLVLQAGRIEARQVSNGRSRKPEAPAADVEVPA